MIETIGITLFWAGLISSPFWARLVLYPVGGLIDLVVFLCRPIPTIASVICGVLVVAATPAIIALWVWG